MRHIGAMLGAVVATLCACGSGDMPSSAQGSAATVGAASAPSAGSAPGPAPQTATDALQIACRATVETVVTAREGISEPSVRRALDELLHDTSDADPAASPFAQLAAQHGVSPCALIDEMSTPRADFELPHITGPAEPDSDGPSVVMGRVGISYDGDLMPLEELHQRLRAKPVKGRLRLILARSLAMKQVRGILSAVTSIGLLCDQNRRTVLVPLDVVRKPARTATVVTLTSDRIRATRDKVVLADAPADGGLGGIVRALVDARGAGPALPVTLVADDSVTIERLAEALGAVRVIASPVVIAASVP